jgi:hypothetical protein
MYLERFILEFNKFLLWLNLDKIPNIPKSDLYSVSENWVLFVDLNWDSIIFYYEYLLWEKYFNEYKKNWLIYWLISEEKEGLLEKKAYIDANNNIYNWKYLELIEEWIFNILDLVKRNKNTVFWELFYDNKILRNFDIWNAELINEINDFIIEFKYILTWNNKLIILYKILHIIIEENFEKNFLDIEREIQATFDTKDLKILKEEFYYFLNDLKTLK